MISKKKLTALAVASLFVTPVMAVAQETIYADEKGVQGNSGYISAGDELFQTAIDKSVNTDHVDGVKVSMWGHNEDLTKDGLAHITLKKPSGYKIKKIDFADNSRLVTTNHKAQLTLQNTSVELTEGLIFRAASKQYENTAITKDSVGKLTSKNDVYLDNSTLKGDVVNRYWSYNEAGTNHFYDIALNQETNIHLSDNSQWIGNLKENINLGTSMGKPVSKKDVNGNYSVELKDNSSWIGGIDIVDNSKADVAIDETSSWLANSNARVNQLRLAEGGRMTARNAEVTVDNFSGQGNIVLDTNGVVTVNNASNKVNATFTSLDGSKLTTKDQVNANVTIAGALADEMGMDAVIDAYNTNKNFEGKGTITFSGGLLGDDVYGQNNDQNQFVQQGTRKNAQLVSIGESTAITMMQWRADADDMAQRMGDLRNNNGTVGVWARTFGGKAEAGHVDNKYYGVQAGVDTQIATTGPKQFVGGAVSYTTGDATFANGTGENYMGTLTGYSTWLFDNGAYVDVAAKWGKLNNEFDLGVEGKQLAGKYSTQAIALTVESGHRFPITNLTYVEPQVAFTASHIFGEDYGTTHGATIEQDSINSYVARVGVQAGLNCPDNMGSVFVRASYLYDFDGETSTVARMANAKDANRFDQDFGGGWYELGLGMNVNFTKNLYGYADFEYVTGGEIKTPYRWNAGLRYAF